MLHDFLVFLDGKKEGGETIIVILFLLKII